MILLIIIILLRAITVKNSKLFSFSQCIVAIERGAQDRARTRGWIKRALMKASQRCQAAAAAASRMVKEPIESLRDS